MKPALKDNSRIPIAIAACVLGSAQALLLILKLSGAVSWPWWAVLLPAELAWLFLFIVSAVVVAILVAIPDVDNETGSDGQP
jgi:hypothetical protein